MRSGRTRTGQLIGGVALALGVLTGAQCVPPQLGRRNIIKNALSGLKVHPRISNGSSSGGWLKPIHLLRGFAGRAPSPSSS